MKDYFDVVKNKLITLNETQGLPPQAVQVLALIIASSHTYYNALIWGAT